MKHAQKINLALPDVAHTLRKNTRTIATHGMKGRGQIYKKYITRTNATKMLNALPNEVRGAVKGLFISNIEPVAAHVHTEDKCVINMYINASGAKTVFYEGVVKPIKEHELTKGHQYFYAEMSLLEPSEHFEANSGEVWLINTKQPHAVLANDICEDRWAVQIYLSLPFEEIKKVLYAKNYIDA